MFKKFLIFLSLCFVFVVIAFYNKTSAYDDQTTHPALTDEIVDFYNLSFPDKQLTPQQKEWIVEGSILEDTPPRWINHFYDPINKIGWSGEHTGKYDAETVRLVSQKLIAPYGITPVSSLNWLHNEQLQAQYAFYKGVKTWERGILEMVKGNEEEAYKILGYILHLVEDVSVPEHTRNDTHAHELEGATGDFGSPYEEYSKQYNRQNLNLASDFYQQGLRPLTKSTIDEYLISLAEYSNKYFFSKDTINDPKYQNPKIIRDDGSFGYGKDENGKEFVLAKVKKSEDENNKFNFQKTLIIEPSDKSILDNYFSRLSRQAVLHGAGVIELFRNEAALKKEYPAHIVVYDSSIFNYFKIPRVSITGELAKIKNTASSFFAQVGSKVGNVVSTVGNFFSRDDNQGFQPAGEISLQTEESENGEGGSQTENVQSIGQTKINESQNNQSQTQQVQSQTQKFDSSSKLQKQSIEQDEEVLQNQQSQQATTTQQTPQQTETQTATQSFKECGFSINQQPSHSKIIINEVAWMGTSASANDEWIELKNISSGEVDLTDWQLIDQGEQIKINLASINGSKIYKSSQFILLERTDDDSVPNITADLIYSGALSNSSEGLRLFDGQCNLIDEILVNPEWPAGNNTSANERRTMERNANDFNWHTSSVIAGTPKQNNSTPTTVSSGGGGGGAISNQQQASTEIRITEIMYDLVGSDSGREWVEIFNAGSSAVNLEGWKFYEDNTNHSLNLIRGSVNLEAGGYAIIVDDSNKFLQDWPQYTGALFDSSFSLSNSGETIAIKNGDTVIDEVNYNSSQGANGDGNSLQLINNQWLPTAPTPGSANQVSQNNQAPGASFVNYLLISEVYPDKTGNNFDFVEIYNPTNSFVPLSDYSLKILKGEATSTDSLTSFSASHTIASKSFFLIGLDNYSQSTSTAADISRSSSFLPTTQTAIVILYRNDDSIDEFNYNPENFVFGQSLERKAFNNNQCVFAQNENEFLGNGCDTDGVDYFEIRSAPNPQNSASFPEPRNAPTAPADFNIQYSTSTMELIFNWQPSQDYSGVTSTLTYKISDISVSTSTLPTIETASTTASVSIIETGRNYQFSIQAFDRDGLGSATSSAQIDVPAPQNNSPIVLMSQLDDSAFSTLTPTSSISNYSIVNYGYQEFGNGLSGKLHSLVLKVSSGNGANRFELREYGDSNYSQLERYWPSYDPVLGFNTTDFIVKRADGSVWEFRQVANFDDFEDITIEFSNIEVNPSKYYRLFFDSGDASRRIFFKGSNGDVGFGRFNFCWATGGPWSGIPTQCRDIDFDIYFILKILP